MSCATRNIPSHLAPSGPRRRPALSKADADADYSAPCPLLSSTNSLSGVVFTSPTPTSGVCPVAQESLPPMASLSRTSK
eukprot:scaffold368_cov127-Isochrysis_galbana.AAC.5